MKKLLLFFTVFLSACAPAILSLFIAYAQQSEGAEVVCDTPDKVLEIVFTSVPDALLVKISDTKPLYMEFTSPSHPTNLQVYFDENNCAMYTVEISDVEG